MESVQDKFHRGLAEFKKGNYGDAFSLFTDVTQHDAQFSDAYYHLGIIYHHQDDYDLATRYFDMAIRANPDHYGARAQLGLLDESASKTSPSADLSGYSEEEFFERLKEDQKEAANNLIEAMETSGLASRLDPTSVYIDRVIFTGGKYIAPVAPALMRAFEYIAPAAPAVIGALLVSSLFGSMDIAPFLPMLITTLVIFLGMQFYVKSQFQ